MWRDLSGLRGHWTFFTTREASLRLYLPDSCMLYYLDVILVLQPHALSRSDDGQAIGKQSLHRNAHEIENRISKSKIEFRNRNCVCVWVGVAVPFMLFTFRPSPPRASTLCRFLLPVSTHPLHTHFRFRNFEIEIISNGLLERQRKRGVVRASRPLDFFSRRVKLRCAYTA